MSERTLIIVKPDAAARNAVGQVLTFFEQAGLRLVAARWLRLTQQEARDFYAVHRDKSFFESLTRFMSEGPVFVAVLEGDGAIDRARSVMGPTDPRQASPGTIRHALGTDVERNAVHGSDSPDSARGEISYFFGAMDIVSH